MRPLLAIERLNGDTEVVPLKCTWDGAPLLPQIGHYVFIGQVTCQVTSIKWNMNTEEIIVKASEVLN
jgi:hypothetical protein